MGSEEEIEVYDMLDRFKEFYPEINSVKKILTHYPIALGGEDSFVQDFAGILAGGSREARQIYRTAADIQEKAALTVSLCNQCAAQHGLLLKLRKKPLKKQIN